MKQWCLLIIKSICFLASALFFGAAMCAIWLPLTAFVGAILFLAVFPILENISFLDLDTQSTLAYWISFGIPLFFGIFVYIGSLFLSYALCFRDGDLDF